MQLRFYLSSGFDILQEFLLGYDIILLTCFFVFFFILDYSESWLAVHSIAQAICLSLTIIFWLTGIIEPIRSGIRDPKLGIGKQEEDDFFTAEENIQRKKLDIEVEETEEHAKKREVWCLTYR